MKNSAKALILNASAGSGKTYRLAYKYILDVLSDRPDELGGGFDPRSYRHILAVTFTNKATEEMKSRILNQIHTLATGRQSDYLDALIKDTGLTEEVLRHRALQVRSAILHGYSRFSILTNDTFFQRILRAFVKELGIELNYSIELDTAPIFTKSVDALLEGIDQNKELQRWVRDMALDNIKQGKAWKIREGFTRLRRELFKENTKEPIASITNKEELKQEVFRYTNIVDKRIEQLRALAAQASALIADSGFTHADFMRNFTKLFDTVAAGEPYKPSATIIKYCDGDVAAWCRKNEKRTALFALAKQLQPMLKQIIDIAPLTKSRDLLLGNYHSFALLNDIYHMSLKICRDDNTMLLSETKHAIAEFLTESDAPFIYEKVGNRFERYMIDEFQDTSFKEWKNFLPLLRNAMSQSADTVLLLVGDIKQSIYRWRGGDWKILASIAPADISQGGYQYKSEPLKDNYRSLVNIVEFNKMFFNAAIPLENDHLNEMLDVALQADLITHDLHSRLYNSIKLAYADHEQTAKRKSHNKGYVRVSTYDESPDLVGCIREVLDQGYKPCDITVLIRNNRESYPIAQQLLEAGNCDDPRYRFDITTQEALLLGNSQALEFIIAIMRLALNRDDVISLAIYNRYTKACDFKAKLLDEEHHFLNAIRVSSPEEAFEKIVIRFGDLLAPHTAYVQALHEHVSKFCSSKVADISLFLKWWEENKNDKSLIVERSERTLEIMTIHKAKGLENKVIIIPYCKWSLKPKSSNGSITNIVWAKPSAKSGVNIKSFPVPFSTDVDSSIFSEAFFEESACALIESLNLLYVALTRAGEQLYIFVPERKSTSINDVGALFRQTLEFKEGRYELGEPEGPEPEKERREIARGERHNVRMEDYPTSELPLQLSIRESRYFDEESDLRLSPRDEGILLHKVMENASTRDDIYRAGEQAIIDGLLSREVWSELKGRIEKMLDGSIAGEWFDGSWEQVRSESSIIGSKDGLKRPDRVMLRGRKAVVVDYKFGHQTASHTKQMGEYIALLRQMGYTDVGGYLWYVREQRIVPYDEPTLFGAQ